MRATNCAALPRAPPGTVAAKQLRHRIGRGFKKLLWKRPKLSYISANVDRLSRDAHFLLGLRDAGIDFVCPDMPELDRFTVGIHALIAERERDMISARTKAALAAAKRRGTVLGGDRGGRPTNKTRALARGRRARAGAGPNT